MLLTVFIGLLALSFCVITRSQLQDYEFAYRTKRNKSNARLNDVPFKDNTKAFTICFRIFHAEARVTYLSYAVPSDPSNIAVEVFNNATELWVSNTKLRFDTDEPEQRKWIHYCYTWDANDGKVQLFKQGKKVAENTFEESKSLSITGNGILILGQRQHSYGGDFDKSTSTPAIFTDVEIWDRVLSDCEVLAASYNNLAGNIVNWKCVQDKWVVQYCLKRESNYIAKLLKTPPTEIMNLKTCILEDIPVTSISCNDGQISLPAGYIPSGDVTQPSVNVPAENVKNPGV